MVAKYSLWPHQEECIKRALGQDTFGLFMQMGCGKTAAAIRVLATRMNQNKRKLRTLIFAPPVVCPNWARELQKFSEIPESDIQVLSGSGKDRLEKLKKRKAHIYILNYQSLLMPPLVEELRKFDAEFMILDEIHRCKNPSASTSKRMAELSKPVKYKLMLTGSAILNSCLDLFQQFKILDGGDTFGSNFFAFRARYFVDKNQYMPSHVRFPNWQLKSGSLDKFNAIIHERGFVATKDECMSLPPLVKKRIEIELGPKQKRAYDSMAKDFISFMESGVAVAQLAITKALRLQQIASGFVTTEDGEEVVFEDNPRITALREILEDIFEQGEKPIIWCTFKANYKQVAKVLDSMKVGYVQLTGETSPKQRQISVDRFNQDEEIRAIIANPSSGGIGISLIASSYSVYYSRNFSLEADIQSESRNHRGGSEVHEKITRIDITAKDTIDDLILEKLQSKQAISDKVLREMVDKL